MKSDGELKRLLDLCEVITAYNSCLYTGHAWSRSWTSTGTDEIPEYVPLICLTSSPD